MNISMIIAVIILLANIGQIHAAAPADLISIWPPEIAFQNGRSIEHVQLLQSYHLKIRFRPLSPKQVAIRVRVTVQLRVKMDFV